MNVIQKVVVNWYNWKRNYYSKKMLKYCDLMGNPNGRKFELKYQKALNKMNMARVKRDWYSETPKGV